MIQGSINQLLSMAAIGAHLSPYFQRREEVIQTKNQSNVTSKVGEVLKEKSKSELKDAIGDTSKTVSPETQGLGLTTPEEKAKYFLSKEQKRVGQSREAVRQQLLANAPIPMMGRRDNK